MGNTTNGAPVIDRRHVSVAVSDYGTQGYIGPFYTLDPSLYNVMKAGQCIVDVVR